MRSWVWIIIVILLGIFCIYLWGQVSEGNKKIDSLNQQIEWMEDQGKQAQAAIEKLNRNCRH